MMGFDILSDDSFGLCNHNISSRKSDYVVESVLDAILGLVSALSQRGKNAKEDVRAHRR